METTTQNTTAAPTTRGVAFLATHPELLDGAYAVSVYENEVKIQGRMTDMLDTILALHDLDPDAKVVRKRINSDSGDTYTTITGNVGVRVELVLVTPATQDEAVQS
ncbi:MAG TPA: hypothetical protein VG502_00925 [Flexivirga sp.]|uniref:hypothetical protein n=1 Tax=Flexivirga sp. TaxID=1962927 RepID=UPI002B657893|nr:hypothetical protein [Flexivirga sp.]HWC20836.1 hypothetical protein [Flexivirga sp.]